MIYAVISVCLFLLTVFIWYLAKRPMVYKNKNLSELDECFLTLSNCVPGSVLIVEHVGSDKFFQFALHENKGIKVFNFGFPNAPWSRVYFEKLKDVLREEGVNFEITQTGENNVSEFLEINLQISSIKNGELKKFLKLVLSSLSIGESDLFNFVFDASISKNVLNRYKTA